MADTLHSSAVHSGPAPLTEDAFIADRQRFWTAFTGFTLASVIVAAAILILLAIFLL